MKTLLLAISIVMCLQPISLLATTLYNGPETELITLINSQREATGISPLSINWEVARLARYKSEEMMKHNLFGHESLIYGSPSQLLDRFSIPHSTLGANIAMGQETAQEVLKDWQNSPGHVSNLLNADFTSAGVGLCWDDEGIPYWTLILVGE